MAEVEDAVKRIQGMKGVKGSLIINQDGVCVRATNIPPASVTHYCALLHMLVKKAKSSIRELDQTNDLTFIRVRTRTNEIMIAPGGDFSLIVLQEPSAEPS